MTITRRQFLMTVASASALARSPLRPGRYPAQRPVPSPAQLTWQQDELALFLHFGVNTFTDREWGDGREDPGIFAPAALDARQWARAARSAGFRAMILTAKHHDGFCLWPSATTRHSVAASSWRGGAGDVVREFTDACRDLGLRAGLYLSPWDRNASSYGSSGYHDFYCDQLTELLTRYGPIHEVWFDGANGEGPNGRRQEYDWARYWGLVRRLQPEAVIFSDAGPDVRWVGNENGQAAETNWSTVDPAVVPFPGAQGPGVTEMLQHGDPRGTVWRPAETDVSIRPGWFYHPVEDARVKSVNELVDLYFASVGRNSKLLLNVPPTRDGLLHPTDVARLQGLRSRLDQAFAGDRFVDVRAGRATTVSVADLREDITQGQAVSRYTLEGLLAGVSGDGGTWRVLSRGTTIGHRKLDGFLRVRLTGVRLRIDESVGEPGPVRIGLY
jgi:alpha-L-fucosidase